MESRLCSGMSDFMHTAPDSAALAAKLLCPLCAAHQILLGHGRPAGLDGLDKVLDLERWLLQLVAVDLGPGHFLCAGIAGRAGSQFLFAFGGCDLKIDVSVGF